MILSFKASVSPCFIFTLFLSKHFMAYLKVHAYKEDEGEVKARSPHQAAQTCGLFLQLRKKSRWCPGALQEIPLHFAHTVGRKQSQAMRGIFLTMWIEGLLR